jgi:hypothetical protein
MARPFAEMRLRTVQKRSALEGADLKQLSGLWGQKKTGNSSMLKHHGQFHVVNTYAEIRIIPLSCRAIELRETHVGEVAAGGATWRSLQRLPLQRRSRPPVSPIRQRYRA